jgi:hypothetical protein
MLRAFGLSILVENERPPGAWREEPPGAWGAQSPGARDEESRAVGERRHEPEMALRRASAEEIKRAWSGRAARGWEAEIDGAHLEVEVGEAGDHRFVHGERAVHHLSADGRLLLCAPMQEEGQLWWRLVLDSVLFSVALLAGREALHAGAIAVGGEAVAITAPAGGGKSTLLAELVKRGAPLLSDDIVALEARDEAAPPAVAQQASGEAAALAHAGPPLMTLPAGVELGEPIAQLNGEQWAAVPVQAGPLPLGAIVILERRGGRKLEVKRMSSPFAALMRALLRFPRTPEREAARFELASAISLHTGVLRLSADPLTPAAALADKLLEALSDPPTTATLRRAR